jgi:hypothetical protein
MNIKVMSPEQLYDSLETVMGGFNLKAARGGKNINKAGKKKAVNKKKQANNKKKQKPGRPGPRAQFVAFFSAGESTNPISYEAGIPQALRLMNSPQFSNGNALLNKVLNQDNRSPAKVIEQLYLATLSRRPTAAESTRLSGYVRDQEAAFRKAYSDILWALLNSSEFMLNH